MSSNTSVADGIPSTNTSVNSPAESAYNSSSKRRRASTIGSRGVANLTPDQLAKKRANDRDAQRAIRERTKNQIEGLELKIQQLTSQQPYQDLQRVVRQKEAVEAENADIKRRLNAIVNLIQPLLGARSLGDQPLGDLLASPFHETPSPVSRSSPRFPPVFQNGGTNGALVLPYSERSTHHGHSPISPIHTPPYAAWHAPMIVNPSMTVPTPDGFSPGSIAGQRQMLVQRQSQSSTTGFIPRLHLQQTRQEYEPRKGPSSLPSDSHITLASPSLQSSVGTKQIHGGNEFAQGAFSMVIPHTGSSCPLDTLMLDFVHENRRRRLGGEPDANLVGPAYPSFLSLLKPDSGAYSHPLSRFFTDILSTFPDISTPPERIAVFYVMFLNMRWWIAPTRENYDRLPAFAKPTPAQTFTPHPIWMDNLPWPQMRDFMVRNHHQFPFDGFFIPYTTTLSLNWPYEPLDTLLSMSDSDELSLNPVFEKHIRKLDNWSLGTPFAVAFPNLVESVRIVDVIKPCQKVT